MHDNRTFILNIIFLSNSINNFFFVFNGRTYIIYHLLPKTYVQKS